MIRHAIFERHQPSKWPPTEPAMTIFGVIKFLPSDKLIEPRQLPQWPSGTGPPGINQWDVNSTMTRGCNFPYFFLSYIFKHFFFLFCTVLAENKWQATIEVRTNIQRTGDKMSSFRFGNKIVSIYLVVRWRCCSFACVRGLCIVRRPKIGSYFSLFALQKYRVTKRFVNV